MGTYDNKKHISTKWRDARGMSGGATRGEQDLQKHTHSRTQETEDVHTERSSSWF